MFPPGRTGEPVVIQVPKGARQTRTRLAHVATADYDGWVRNLKWHTISEYPGPHWSALARNKSGH